MRKLLIFLLVGPMLLLTSCWDRLDIEDNAFILGVAIDEGQEDQLMVTFQVALPAAFGGESSGGKDEATWNVTVMDEDIYGASKQLFRNLDKNPTFQHLQVVLFGEKYARSGIEDSLDFMFRDPNLRRKTVVAVVEGEAKAAMEVKPKTAQAVSLYLGQIFQNNADNSFEIFSYQNVGKLHENFVRESPVTMGKVRVEEDKLNVAGSGVFKDWKLIGWYSGREIEGLRLLMGKINGGVIGLKVPEDKGTQITLSIFDSNTSLVPELKDGKIIARSKIRLEGEIASERNPYIKPSAELIQYWQSCFEKYIEEEVQNTFEKGRDVFDNDTFEMDGKMRNYYPDFWEKNKKNWPEIFKTVELQVDAEVKIRRIGEVKY